MPQLVEITFDERPGDETLVHRVRNFGEDLWRSFRTGDRAKIDLAAVDAATTSLELLIVAPEYRDLVLSTIRKTLDEHYFTDIAHVSEKPASEVQR
jgi:hypothetical protein